MMMIPYAMSTKVWIEIEVLEMHRGKAEHSTATATEIVIMVIIIIGSQGLASKLSKCARVCSGLWLWRAWRGRSFQRPSPPR